MTFPTSLSSQSPTSLSTLSSPFHALPIDLIKRMTDFLDWPSRKSFLFQTGKSLRERIENSTQFKIITESYYSIIITNIIKKHLSPNQNPSSKKPKFVDFSEQILQNKADFYTGLVLHNPSWKELRNFALQPKKTYENIKYLDIFLEKE